VKRLLAALLALAAISGSARAASFSVVPNAPLTAPSAALPNEASSLLLPQAFLQPPAQPEVRTVQQLQPIWERAGATYGIPWQVLAAINKIESDFGRNMGPSSAGAVGWMQFMPDTWLRWGTDGNGDGVADPWSPDDAILSAARNLAASGGATDIRSAVFSYNHAGWYVDEVLSLAQEFGSGGIQATFQLDQMQQSLDAAQRRVSDVNGRLEAALRAERRLAVHAAALAADVDRAALLSDKLARQKVATLAGVRKDEADAQVLALQGELAQAQADLAAARDASRTSSFAQGSGAVLAAPAYNGDYVFPVGGGAGTVSASHTHHDYPAVDIAAPEGAPVYALTNAVVVRAWHDDARCGTGTTISGADGHRWTYCHLSYLEPTIRPGAQLTAGDPVGLVGHTGHATGPHLHLQLQPASEWPQRMAWFQAFAGTAFSWQDAAPPGEPDVSRAATGRDVFAAPPSDSGPVIAFTRTGA
jgi:murein DD-endopeptidase MepM/ murein hydrolase activator NlpD